jgi:hypothetical protein
MLFLGAAGKETPPIGPSDRSDEKLAIVRGALMFLHAGQLAVGACEQGGRPLQCHLPVTSDKKLSHCWEIAANNPSKVISIPNSILSNGGNTDKRLPSYL